MAIIVINEDSEVGNETDGIPEAPTKCQVHIEKHPITQAMII